MALFSNCDTRWSIVEMFAFAFYIEISAMNDAPWSSRLLLQTVYNTLHVQHLYIVVSRVLFLSLCKLCLCQCCSLPQAFFLSASLSLSHSTCRKTDIPQLPVFRYFIIMTDNHLEEFFFLSQNKSLNNVLSLQASCPTRFVCVQYVLF